MYKKYLSIFVVILIIVFGFSIHEKVLAVDDDFTVTYTDSEVVCVACGGPGATNTANNPNAGLKNPIHADSKVIYVVSDSAELLSSFDPQKLNTFVWFELENKPNQKIGYKNIGSVKDPSTEFCLINYFQLKNLTPNTTYKARAVGQNSSGTTYGPWMTFITLPENTNQGQQVSTGDLTPRIAFWYGKVNQHVDEAGFWRTDPDGSRGVNDANSDPLEYCQRWYPNTTYVRDYKLETISTWKRENIYEQSDYTNTVMSRECKTGAPLPSVDISISEDTVLYGGEATLTWTATNASSCKASDGWSGDKNKNGGSELIKNIGSNKTFVITCNNNQGINTDSVTVSVVASPSVYLGVNTSSVSPGGTVYLQWNAQDAKSCEGVSTPDTAWSGPKTLIMVTSGNGSQYISNLTEDTTFTLNCIPTVPGPVKSKSVTVTVGSSGLTVNLTAAPTFINEGGSTSLTWTSTNTVSCEAGGDWDGGKSSNSIEPVVISNITTNKVFTLTCKNSKGEEKTSETSVSVSLNPIINFSADPDVAPYNGSTSLSWSVLNATSCSASGGWNGNKSPKEGDQIVSGLKEDTTFTLTCTGSGGKASRSILVKVGAITPSVTMLANPTSVVYDGSTTLSWKGLNVTSCTASDGWTGNKSPVEGNQIISKLKQTTTFTISCTGPGGRVTDSILISVGSAPEPEVVQESILLNNTRVLQGKTVLKWTVVNLEKCEATTDNPTSGVGWSGNKTSTPSPYNGQTTGVSVTKAFPNTTKYTLSCIGIKSKKKLLYELSLHTTSPDSSGTNLPVYNEN